MSLPIWTADALRAEIRPYQGTVWRIIKAEYQLGIELLTSGPNEKNHLNNGAGIDNTDHS